MVTSSLDAMVPDVMLLKGPKSIGKRSLAEYLAKRYSAHPADILHIRHLTADAAREVKEFASMSPFGSIKFILIALDGASEAAQNILLKLLEEPPAKTKIILYGQPPVMATVESRCAVYRMGLLSNNVVATILTEKMGIAADKALAASRRSGGSVKAALESFESESNKMAVLNILNSLAQRDSGLYQASLGRWSQEEHDLLSTWLSEALTGRWSVFTEEESQGLEKDPVLLRRLMKLTASKARPRLAMKAARDNLIED